MSEELENEYAIAGMGVAKARSIDFTSAYTGGNGLLEDDYSISRPGLTWDDYDNFRPSERIPTSHRNIMYEVHRVYERHGLVKNMIDMMADLTMSGISVSHPRPNVQRFFENWFMRVNGIERSERFLNNLYKFGNVIVDRYETPWTVTMEQSLKTARADLAPVTAKKVIPSQYNFLNPMMVDVIHGAISTFVDGQKNYGIRLPRSFRELLKKSKPTEIEQKIIDSIPDHVKKMILESDDFSMVPLEGHNIDVYHYKKEDWQSWAKPITYSILRPIQLLEKAEMADITALDGAVDHVRLFKLGDKEKGINPTPEAFEKLIQLLTVNNGAGIRNIVWGEDIKIEESSIDIHQFLGNDKYAPTLNRIYAGLGVPSTLTGSETGGGGTTNNLVSLKTLVKRLMYGRNQLISFWTKELEIVRNTMGFSQPAEIEFEVPNFGDEEVEKRLWLELADRDIVSHEWVQKRFAASPSLEKSRLGRELKKKTPKRGPFTSPNEVKKASELKAEENVTAPDNPNPNRSKSPGRPPGVKDSEPRTRRFTPQIRAKRIEADRIQDLIDKEVNPMAIAAFGKKNMRFLTKDEVEQLEELKLITLFNMASAEDDVVEATQKSLDVDLLEEIYTEISDLTAELGRSLTQAERKNLLSELWAIYGVNN